MKRFRSFRKSLREKCQEEKYEFESRGTIKKRFIDTYVNKLPVAPDKTRPSKQKNTDNKGS